MALKGFGDKEENFGFSFSQSRKAQQGINEISRIETATIIVATDGTGDFETLQEAINDIKNTGGYIQLKEGIFTISEQITLSGNITITGTGHETKLISSGSITSIFLIQGDNIEISNMFIQGNLLTTDGINQTAGTKTNIRIKDVFFRSCNIAIKGSWQNVSIINNSFSKFNEAINASSISFQSVINGNQFGIEDDSDNKKAITGTWEVGSISGNTAFCTHFIDASIYGLSITANSLQESTLSILGGSGSSSYTGNRIGGLIINSNWNAIVANSRGGTITNNGSNNVVEHNP